jgi:WD40 repeat protein
MVAAGSALRGISSGDTGRERGVRIWNAVTGKLRLSWLGHDDGIRTVTFSPDDRLLISASRDGTIKYWDTGSAKNVATILVSNDGHWAVLSPSGLFAADNGDTSLFGFARGLSARPSSDFKDKLYKPDLIAELLKGDPHHRYAAAAKQVDLEKMWDETR